MPTPATPRDDLNALLQQHLGLPASAIPSTLLDEVMARVPIWSRSALPTPTPVRRTDWAKVEVSQPVVKGWVASRDMEILDDWLVNAPPHQKLASTIFQDCLMRGWEAGAHRLWASDRLNHGPALINAWAPSRGDHPTAPWIGPWLETLTWPAQEAGTVAWASSLNRARTAALKNAWDMKAPKRWNDYVRRGVVANNTIGQTLLETVGQAPEKHAWAQTAFADLLKVKALWSLASVLNALRFNRPGQVDAFLDAKRCGLDERQRVVLLCQVALAGAHKGLADPALGPRTFDACLRWGLSLSATFIRNEMYDSPFHSAFHSDVIQIELDQLNHRWKADHAPSLRTAQSTLYLADHWGYDPTSKAAKTWNQDDVRETRRLAFAQALEARVLREAIEQDPMAEPPIARPRRTRL